MKKRLQVIFSGSVQGVGFRFTAERLARRFPIAGYVRNLPNGKVEIVAEGEEKSVRDFLAAIREAFNDHIREVEPQWSEAADEFNGFGARF